MHSAGLHSGGVVAKTPRTAACQASLSMDFPGKTTGVSCHFLFHTNLCLFLLYFPLLLFQEGSQIFVFSYLGLMVARERAGVTWQPSLKALGIRYSKYSLFEGIGLGQSKE